MPCYTILPVFSYTEGTEDMEVGLSEVEDLVDICARKRRSKKLIILMDSDRLDNPQRRLKKANGEDTVLGSVN